MLLKRPPSDTAERDLKMMEQLIRTSVSINPQLTGGQATHAFVAQMSCPTTSSLQGDRRTTPSDNPQPLASPTDASDAQAGAASYFFQKKAADFRELKKDIEAQQDALERQKRLLREKVAREIVDFIVLMSIDPKSVTARKLTTAFGTFLREVGLDNQTTFSGVKR